MINGLQREKKQKQKQEEMGERRAGEAGSKGGEFEGVKVEREGDGKGEEMMQDVDDTKHSAFIHSSS